MSWAHLSWRKYNFGKPERKKPEFDTARPINCPINKCAFDNLCLTFFFIIALSLAFLIYFKSIMMSVNKLKKSIIMCSACIYLKLYCIFVVVK